MGVKLFTITFFLNSEMHTNIKPLPSLVLSNAIACGIENREVVYCDKYPFVNMVAFYKKTLAFSSISFCIFSWIKTVQHLAWTILGMPDLEPFSLGDSPSDYIVEIMYAVFILSALILLVNMMIAVLSSTYERVEV